MAAVDVAARLSSASPHFPQPTARLSAAIGRPCSMPAGACSGFLNRRLPGYWKIAQAAVRKEPRAIFWVPFTYSGYLRLAEAALAEYHHSKAAHFPGTSDNRAWDFLAYVVFKQLDQWPHAQARELRRELVNFATTTLGPEYATVDERSRR